MKYSSSFPMGNVRVRTEAFPGPYFNHLFIESPRSSVVVCKPIAFIDRKSRTGLGKWVVADSLRSEVVIVYQRNMAPCFSSLEKKSFILGFCCFLFNVSEREFTILVSLRIPKPKKFKEKNR